MAAKARTVLLSLAACLPVFANIPRLSPVAEKPHQGVADFAQASHRGPATANALTAPGIAGCLYDSGRRSRSTSKERDAESGLDYFGARYYSGAQGKPFADQDPYEPQSWNLYSYVRNNPLAFIDPSGQDCVYTNNYNSDGTVTVETGNCSQKGGAFVNGTIDTNSLTVHNGALEFGYTDPNGAAGIHSMGLPEAQTPGILALREAGIRAGRDLTTSAILMAGMATAIAGTHAAPAVLTALTSSEVGAG